MKIEIPWWVIITAIVIAILMIPSIRGSAFPRIKSGLQDTVQVAREIGGIK